MTSGYEKSPDYGGRRLSKRELVVLAITVVLIHIGLLYLLV